MLKAIRMMMNSPIKLDLIDRTYNCTEEVGGGIEMGVPNMVLILRGLDLHWLAAEWRHSGQIVIIPTMDITCIASDPVCK